jgi:hypothetical protein
MDAKAWVAEFHDWCEWMLDRHIQFDVVYFGHPEMWDDQQVLGDLSQYRGLILPSVDCLTDAQASALRDAALSGTEIYTTGSLGTRDEDYNNLSTPRSDGIPLRQARQVATDFAKTLEALGPVQTDAGNDVRITMWKSTEGKWRTVHFFTHQYDKQRDRPIPHGPIEVKLTIPKSMKIDTILATSFDHDEYTLDFDRDNDSLSFTLPRLLQYTMVVLGEKAEWEQAQKEAEARKAADREMVKREALRRDEWVRTQQSEASPSP